MPGSFCFSLFCSLASCGHRIISLLRVITFFSSFLCPFLTNGLFYKQQQICHVATATAFHISFPVNQLECCLILSNSGCFFFNNPISGGSYTSLLPGFREFSAANSSSITGSSYTVKSLACHHLRAGGKLTFNLHLLLLLRMCSAHVKILGFPMGGAY